MQMFRTNNAAAKVTKKNAVTSWSVLLCARLSLTKRKPFCFFSHKKAVKRVTSVKKVCKNAKF